LVLYISANLERNDAKSISLSWSIFTMLCEMQRMCTCLLPTSNKGWAKSSSSSSRNEYYLGGIIALLLQDHRTMSTKSVCSSQYMVTDQHWVTGAQIKHSTLSDRIREWRTEQNGLQFSAEDGKRRHVPNVLPNVSVNFWEFGLEQSLWYSFDGVR